MCIWSASKDRPAGGMASRTRPGPIPGGNSPRCVPRAITRCTTASPQAISSGASPAQVTGAAQVTSDPPAPGDLVPALRWTRLTVLETRDGGLFDATGTVRFRAMYVQHGQRGVLAETSRFVRQDRHWTYLGPID